MKLRLEFELSPQKEEALMDAVVWSMKNDLMTDDELAEAIADELMNSARLVEEK